MPGINFRSIILSVLEVDERIWFQNEEGEKELNQTLLLDLVEKIDDKIINLLLQEESLREKFFAKITPDTTEKQFTYIFKMNEFRFFMEENKIDNSYTAYKNRIGLTDGKKFLKDSNDIVLNWPYKDCVLEGGQSNEEGTDNYFEYSEKTEQYEQKQAKRKEIFFNSVLAPDEIDRLLDPKALVNWKRFTDNGELSMMNYELKRRKDGTIAENMIIKGNNLLAMHSLKKQFAGKVKLIYIDPPYNTGNDGFKYNDNFNHSTWLTFMKNRLEVARELLRDDGVIFVQCDDNEQAYLKVLMDELFGRENFVSNIAIKTASINGFKIYGNKPVRVKEIIIMYSKSRNTYKYKRIYTQQNGYWDSHFSLFYDRENDKVLSLKEVLIKEKIIFKNEKLEDLSIQNKSFKNFYIENKDNIFQTGAYKDSTEKQKSLELKNKIYKVKDSLYLYNGRMVSFLSKSLKEINGNFELALALSDFWDDIDFNNIQNEKGESFSNGKKPEKLIQRIIEISTQPGDIVLDYHLGSGTTAAVAHKMGRQYIGIEQMEYVETIAVERLKKVIGQYTSPAKASTTQEENSRKLTAKERQGLQEILEKIKNSNNSLV
jgi:adenine-specific DNA-methyltransferase